MGEGNRMQGFGWRTWRRDQLEAMRVDGRIILKWILRRWDGREWIVLVCLRTGTSGGSHVNAVMTLWVP